MGSVRAFAFYHVDKKHDLDLYTYIMKKQEKYVQVMAKIQPHIYLSAKHMLLDGKGGGSWQAFIEKSIRDFVVKNLKKK